MPLALPPRATLVRTVCLIALGGVGGAMAQYLHLPMPWLLGALFVSALGVLTPARVMLRDYKFPMPLRTVFVALIGVMIGAQVTPELLTVLRHLPLTLAALALFVCVTHAMNMTLFRKLGGYDRPTAFYAGAPGGLMESILLGENAGADIRILTVQQFLRIIVVITCVPLGLSLWLGTPVGSTTGMALAGRTAPTDVFALLVIAITALAGLGLGRLIRMPAAQLTGPLLLAGVASGMGLIDLHLPVWLIALAQVVIGVSLGLRFQGVDGALLRRSLGLSLLSVSLMILFGSSLALGLHHVTGIEFLHLFISFAPGGVTEMSVIALSLAANPALVSLHHVLRILLTVIEMPIAARWVMRAEDPADKA